MIVTYPQKILLVGKHNLCAMHVNLQVKYDLSLQSNDYEIVDYMMDKFKVATGIGEPKHRPPHRRYKHETQRYDMAGEYIDGEHS